MRAFVESLPTSVSDKLLDLIAATGSGSYGAQAGAAGRKKAFYPEVSATRFAVAWESRVG